MSYILDALRKSDQLRRRSGAPALLLGQAEAVAPKQPALLFYGVFALILLGAGIAIGWLRPWQQGPALPAPIASTATSSAPGNSAAPAVQAGTAPKPAPERYAQNPALAMPVVPAPATQFAPAPAFAAAPAPDQAHARGGRKIEKPNAPPMASAGVPKKAEPPVRVPARSSDDAAAAATAPPPAVMTMAELPLAIQQDLPPMSVSVHAYSGKAGDRLVGINNRLLHEGEDVAPGLKLEQITPDGMILSYKGYAFRRGVH